MKRCCTFRFVLILLFTLLQSVAPLAHAHINGDQANDRVHALELEHGLTDSLSEPTLSAPESPAIGMPHQVSRDDHTPDLAPPRFALSLPPRPVAMRQKTPTIIALHRPIPVCETPFAHAPPALA